MSDLTPADVALQRARQILRFLIAYAERNIPTVRNVAEQPWSMYLKDLPEHPDVVVGDVQLVPTSDAAATTATSDGALLSIRRPKTTPCPTPPDALLPWLLDGWREIDAEPRTAATRNEVRDGETVTVRFDADAKRVDALAGWKRLREAWLITERPTRAALKRFEELFSLRAQLLAESERLELVLGDGRLRWIRPEGKVDHPVLLQRVDLEFSADGPEIRVVDAERAPELATVFLSAAADAAPGSLSQIRRDLEERGFHPLESAATSAFLKRAVGQLHARGEFGDAPSQRVPTEQPHVSRDAVLFLRNRQSGFPAAFQRVLDDLQASDANIPVSVSLLTGVDRKPDNPTTGNDGSPWGEPADVLLSKPANVQQVQIARALDQHRAVLVQGPPGTGKSHTIANLIGHLVAKGLRVLVTSQTTKALRVLRGHVAESIQPLCVSVLESDLDSRRQMEGAVRAILSRFTESTEGQLEQETVKFAQDRSRLLAELRQSTSDLQDMRQGEYAHIQVNGGSLPPSEAAAWVAEHAGDASWIPGKVDALAPLPLSDPELAELYASNAMLSFGMEAELEGELPDPARLPTQEDFATLTRLVVNEPVPSESRWWTRPAEERELEVLRALMTVTTAVAHAVAADAPWQLALISAGHEGEAASALWTELAVLADDVHGRWKRTRSDFMTHECRIAPSLPAARASQVAEELRQHVEQGRGLGAVALLFKSEWKAHLDGMSVNGKRPASSEEFAALREWASLLAIRERLQQRWTRQAIPIGLPPLESMPEPVEPVLREYTNQFQHLLGWWKINWHLLQDRLTFAGFDWHAFRQHHVAVSAPTAPYARDLLLVSETLPDQVRIRLAQAEHARARRELEELATYLAPFRGASSRVLFEAVKSNDVAAYASATVDYRRLLGLRSLHARRSALLQRLAAAAPEWAEQIRRRESPHDAAVLPEDASKAWRWRQYAQEVERRAAWDEQALMTKVHSLQNTLRNVTAQLIDRRAWLGQARRINLEARQALQGWADIQRRIGKGTGKRVPALQAEARRLLSKARDAVPVWIMPLNRVAESIDLAQGRFDVVIIDEASQSDVLGLLAWFLGERICVVGDHEQVSPLAIGQRIDEISALISQHLDEVPNATLYDGRTSIYDLARQSFGSTIALREHFRCVPDIIDFSNHLSYDGEIMPLRDPTSVSRPHVVELMPLAFGAERDGKSNVGEARAIAAILKAAITRPEYRGMTFGAITLLGDEQAELIQRLALDLVGAVDLDVRRFLAGNASQFQGDERDVMLLSMVHSSTGSVLRMVQDEPTKQRFNVAASRARDQLWLVHSLDPSRDLQEGDLRRRLIEHVRNPSAMRSKVIAALGKAESPFEVEVLRRLIAAGYDVEPQVWVGRYRLDMVVRGRGSQAAVECDGARYHGVDELPADLARQAVLERVGWRFARIRGTRFYRNPDAAMLELTRRLADLGVTPMGASGDTKESARSTSPVIEDLLRDVWQIAREHGWVTSPDMTSTPEQLTLAGTE